MSKWTAASCGVTFVCCVLWSACGSSTPRNGPTAPTSIDPSGNATGAVPNPSPTLPEPPVGSGTVAVTAVGDIGWCGSAGVGLTGRLLQEGSGPILLAGDLAYMRGRMEEFRNCFEPDYGRYRSRFRPAPGNHEYEDPGANGYFSYFGDAAGPGRQGYYAFDAAAWRVLMLNSSQPAANGSPQYLWVKSDLQSHRTRCTLAVWHHPYVTSGPNGPNTYMRDMFALLYEAGAEVVVSAHDHFYERFGPQNPAYEADRDRGIRQFIAGTGGAPLYRPVARFPNSETIVEAWGVLRLRLSPMAYDWEFVDASSGAIADRGTASCH